MWSILGVFGFFVFTFIGSVLSVYNEGNRMETGIVYQQEKNKTSFDSMWKTILETAQVTKQYSKDIKSISVETAKARYGEGGSKAIILFLQEQGIQVDSALYSKLMTIIETKRGTFDRSQEALVARLQEYDLWRKSPRVKMVNWLWFMHFPKIDLNKYQVVTSDETQKAFDTKKADKLNVFGE